MKTALEKFEERYVPEPNSGCWLWIGATINNEKGHFKMDGKEWIASRASFHLFCGEIPEGQYVLHRCDTPFCVNPDHLYSGTQLDNMRDAVERNRIKTPAGWNKGLKVPALSALAKSRPRNANGTF